MGSWLHREGLATARPSSLDIYDATSFRCSCSFRRERSCCLLIARPNLLPRNMYGVPARHTRFIQLPRLSEFELNYGNGSWGVYNKIVAQSSQKMHQKPIVKQ